MSGDALTILTARDGAWATKRITRADGGEWRITPYGSATYFSVRQVAVADVTELGQAIRSLEGASKSFVIRGEPLPGTNRDRCRRLLYPHIDDHGEVSGPTFEAAPRRWIALDFDSLPTPRWDPERLAARSAAILRDRDERPAHPPKGADDAEDYYHEGRRGGSADLDPAPIDPVKDWPLVIRAAVATMPPELADAHAWWQLTSSAGIKPGIRLRLWYWCGRPVSDAEAKRWLADSPVDRSLYSPVQPHYTAAPIFRPRSLDPVPVRSGIWWRHVDAVPVPELPEPEPPPAPPEPANRAMPSDALARRAEAYAQAALLGVESATVGGRHPTLMGVAVRLYSLADRGLLDPGDATRRLLAAAHKPLTAAERRQRCMRHGGRPSANEEAIDWARARARVAPDLPEGFA